MTEGAGYGPRGLAAEYSGKAAAYDRLWAPVLRPMTAPLLDELLLGGTRLIVDLGSGTGAMLRDIGTRAPGARILALDAAEGMLRRAPRGAAVAPVVGDAHAVPVRSGSADAALMAFMLFHLDDPAAALREVGRVLRPGGAVGVVTWGRDDQLPGADLWTEEMDAAGAAPDPRDPLLSKQRWMDTPAKLAALLAGAGLRGIHTRAARFEHRFTADALMAISLEVGVAGRRIGSVAPAEADACLARVSARLHALPEEERTFGPEIVWGIAHA